MAHTFGNNSSRGSSATSPVDVSFTPAAGSTCLWLGLVYAGSTDRTGGAPTFRGIPLTQAGTNQRAAASPENTVEAWYLENPPVLAGTLSIPNTGTVTIRSVIATGIAATGFTSKFDVSSVGTGTSTNPSVSITPTVNGAIIFSVVGDGAQTWAPSARSGTQLFDTDNGTEGDGQQYFLQPTAGAQAMSWTFGTSEDWAIVNVAFKEVAIPTLSWQAPGRDVTTGAVPRFRDQLRRAVLPAILAGAFFAPVYPPPVLADAVAPNSGAIARAAPLIQYQSHFGPVFVPTADITVGLTGVSATGSVGTLGPATDKALTGNAVTGSAGTLGVDHAQAVTGNAATGSVGTLGVDHTRAITGNAATGSAGTMGPALSAGITGQAATGSVGTLGPEIAVGVTGNAATGSVGGLAVDTPAADAATGSAAGVVFPPRSVQYQAFTGPVYVPAAAATTIAWLPIYPDQHAPRRSGALQVWAQQHFAVIVDVPPDAWTQTYPDTVPRRRPRPASAELFATPAVPSASGAAADAAAGGSAGVVFPPRTVQYPSTFGPVYVPAAAATTIAWLPTYPVQHAPRRSGALYVWAQQHFAVLTEVVADAWTQLYPDALTRRRPSARGEVFAPPRIVSPDVTVALTGVSATGSVGTLTPAIDKAVTGNAATGAVGALGVDHTQPLTGTAATGAAGTLGPQTDVAATGAAATGSVGTLGVDHAQAVTGNAATGSIGALGPESAVALTGNTATGSAGTVSASASGGDVTVALTGVSATGSVGTLGPELSRDISGVAATGAVGSLTTRDITVALTGVSATGATGYVTASGGIGGTTRRATRARYRFRMGNIASHWWLLLLAYWSA